ncbi:MAG: M23 family metallopeptidase [Anaerolineae bacterium]
MRVKRWLIFASSFVSFLLGVVPTLAQDSSKPFIMPLSQPAGPSTWMFGQPYGNTVGAFNFGTAWYSAGQGLHFGIDISMPCNTPVIAVADGDVIYVDNLNFGAGPHNLILRHSQANVTTLYGHLLDRPPVQQYQPVRQGDVVGYSGDPDVTCDSRPHLHFEVRSLDYRTAFNPVDYIDANWDVLAAMGPFNSNLFEQDLTNPRQWMRLADQPPVSFGGARVNAYTSAWPPPNDERAPNSAAPLRPFTALGDAAWTLRPLGIDGCCATRWWHPTNPDRLFVIDGTPGQNAASFEWDIPGNSMTGYLEPAPPPQFSPDGTHFVRRSGSQIIIHRQADGAEWTVNTSGFTPAINADSTRLLWQVQYGQSVPGATPPQVEIWVSDIDGANARQIMSDTRISASWIDGSRLLVSSSEKTVTTLSVYNVVDGSSFALGSWDRVRGVSIAPGGQRLVYYQSFQSDPTVNAIYALELQAGAQPKRLDWFGAYRWRDAESLYYIPFEPSTPVQTLMYYHVPSGERRILIDPATQPFTIRNGDWSVSPDGRRIVFQNTDGNMMMVEAAG